MSLVDFGPLDLAERGGSGPLQGAVASRVAVALGRVGLAVEAVAGVLGEAGGREEVRVGEEEALPRGARRLERRHVDQVERGGEGEGDPGRRREEDGADEHAVQDGEDRRADNRQEPV